MNTSKIPKSHIYYYSKSCSNNHLVGHIVCHLSNFHCNFLTSRNLNCNFNLICIYLHFNLQFLVENFLMNFLLRIYSISKSCFSNHHHCCISCYHLNFHCTNYFNKNQKNNLHLYDRNLRFKQELRYISFLTRTLRIIFENRFNFRNHHVPCKPHHFSNFHYKNY